MQISNEIQNRPTNPLESRKEQSQVLAILALALASRLGVVYFVLVHFPHGWLYSRGIELGTLAQSLVEGHGLSSPFGGSTGPTALLGPGYPIVIAAVFRLFGCLTFSSSIAVMLLQTLFSVLTVWEIMRIAERWFGIYTGNIAGAFWAVSLPLLLMPTVFWETCLSTLSLIVMIDLASGGLTGYKRLRWVAMGVLCGVAGLTNPALILALLSIYGWAVWQRRKRIPIEAFVGIVVFFLIFAPWPIRNARVLHSFIPLRSTIGYELWIGNRPGATGFLDESPFPALNKEEYDSYAAKGEVRYMADKSQLAHDYVWDHKIGFLKLSFLRVIRFWSGTGTRDGSWVFAAHAMFTACFGLFGVWRLFIRHVRLAVLLCLPLALFPLPYYITHAEFRYRLVLDPILTILAAFSVTAWPVEGKGIVGSGNSTQGSEHYLNEQTRAPNDNLLNDA
jgi:Dolichyl-phosphate-mannose-protein mannosyltransferase